MFKNRNITFKSLYLSILIATGYVPSLLYAQLTVTTGQTAQQLAENLAGPNIQVFNASYVGSLSQRGLYSYSGSALETTGGVVLSTGFATSVVGPNNSGLTSRDLGTPGDQALSTIAGFNTYDAAGIKFDFEVQSDEISFNYIFGSEEYNEYVGTEFNDVFAFFISGPGITGEQNLAVVPTTVDPVTINTINLNNYWQFYVNNEGGIHTHDTQLDGFTIKMTAFKNGLIPCETYTLRLVIADGSDALFDSAVLLQENSLVQSTVDVVSTTPSVDNTALEGCIKASFTFNIDQPLTEEYIIPLEILGTAINGVDYQTIENFVIIPAGQLSATIFIDAFEDGIVEGQETIELVYSATPCSPKDTIRLYIDDMVPIEYTLEGKNLNCYGDYSGEIDLVISGGTAPYTVFLTSFQEEYIVQSTNLPLTGLPADTYYINVNDVYGCNGETAVANGEFDGGAIFLPDGNGQVYSTSINISGFDGAVMTNPNQLQSICMNMEHSALGDVEIRLIAPDMTELILKQRFNHSDGNHTDLGEPVANGPIDGANPDITPGVGYDYCFTHDPFYGTMVQEKGNYSHTYVDATGTTLTDNYLPSGSYTSYQQISSLIGVPLDGEWTLWIKDHKPQDNGYIFNWNVNLIAPSTADSIVLTQPDKFDVSLNSTNPDCGDSNGVIDISVNGDHTPFTFLWSTGDITEDLIGVSAGVYSVEITDTNGCIQDTSFALSNAMGPELSSLITHESCVGLANGSIDLTIVGVIESILWSNGETTEDISGLVPGEYSVTVTAVDGCITSATYIINPATEIKLTAAITNEKCGNFSGEIDLTVTGGTAPYSYSWSNGATTQDVLDLQQDTYIVDVYDALNCHKQGSYSIINEVGNCTPNCDLFIDYSNVTDEYCGDGSGEIQINASSTNSPISASWSSGQTTLSITSLNEGQYTITLIDGLGCELTKSYAVANNTYGLMVSDLLVTNEVCGNSEGSIQYTVSGGNGPYNFTWSNGATSQNLFNIAAGEYTVTVTDQAGCALTKTIIVNNEAAHSLSFQYVMHETCGDSAGSIDINITPTGTYSYLWNNGAITQDLMNLSAGNYYCIITDTNTGCEITTPIYEVLNQSGGLTASVAKTENEICGNGQGKILLNVSGGTPDYFYSWSNGATTSSIFEISQGTYSCTITDDLGCSVVLNDIQILNTSGDLSVSTFVVPDTCSQAKGAIQLSVSGGVMPYSFLWSNGVTTQNAYDLLSGNYSYEVTDSLGCVFSGSQMVQNISGNLSATAELTHPDCGSTNGAIDLTVYNNSGTLSYSWSNGTTTEDLVNVTNGNYQVLITDIDGCSLISSYSLIGNLQVSETINQENCSQEDGSIVLSVSGGSGIEYLWSNGGSTNPLNSLKSNNYSVVITSFENCSFSGEFFVPENTNCYLLCQNTSTDSPSGTLFDSGGPTGNYQNNENCSFLIAPLCADTVKLQFTSFQTQPSYDVVSIYDGENTGGTLLATLSGSPSLTTEYTAASGKMFITFISNASTVYSGFSANWSTVDIEEPDATFTYSGNAEVGETITFTSNTGYTAYSWDFGDGNVSNLQNPSHIFTSEGTYTVSLTVNNGCESSTYTTTLIIETNDLNDLTKEWIKVYPNPSTSGIFFISGELENNKDVQIHDQMGRLIDDRISKVDQDYYVIDLSNEAKGVYYLKYGKQVYKLVK